MDLLPVELVLGFLRSLEVIEEDMDKLFDQRYGNMVYYQILEPGRAGAAAVT